MVKDYFKESLNIVILEDNLSFLEILELKISSLGFKTFTFTDADKAIEFIKANNMVFLITDFSLTNSNAKEIITNLNKNGFNIPFIVVTGEGNEKIASEVMKLGALDYIIKDSEFLSNIEGKFLDALNKYQSILEKIEWQKKIEISEQKYHKIFDNILDIYFEVSLNRVILEISPSVKTILGYERDEIIGKKFNFFTENVNFNFVAKTLLKKKILKTFRCVLSTKEGVKKQIDISIKFINNTFIGMIRDVSEIYELENKISKISIETEEKTKQQFAESLHDDIGPLLSSVKIYLSLIEKEDRPKEEKASLLDFTKSIVDDAIKKVRNLTNELSPTILQDFGLKKAIETIINNYKLEKFNIKFNFDVDEKIEAINEIVIYRTISELLNNTFKHSNALNVTINIKYIDNNIYVYYSDDGIGFDKEKIFNSNKGHGFIFMNNRIKQIGGKIKYITSKNKGLKVIININDVN